MIKSLQWNERHVSTGTAADKRNGRALLNAQGFCTICEKIEMTLDTKASESLTGWALGSLSIIRRRKSTCYLCHILYYLVHEHFTKYGMTLSPESTIDLRRLNHDIEGRREFSSHYSVVVRAGDTSSIILHDAFRPALLSQRAIPLRGPFHSDLSINLSKKIRILQEKLSHCDKYHTESCHGVAGRERPCPVYFIDTKQLCIVPSTTGSKYVALSYVWGETTQILLTQENASALMQPGGLRQIWHSISRVIREAIQLVSEVDIYENRYLWVDSLCILSNDKEHKHSQINQMDAIYGQSALTIIALAADDASSSLFCSNDTDSGSDRALREVERLKNVEFIPDFRVSGKVVQEADRRGYVYRTRGWTFQEEQLSRRRLYWTQSGFVFRCRLHEWSPARIWNEENDEHIPQCLQKADAINRWASLVETYTSRNLTYQSDALRAFAGIAESLQLPRQLPNSVSLRIVCGICLELFPFSLLWVPLKPKENSQRLAFPSWSWASANSLIRFTQALDSHMSDPAVQVANLTNTIPIPTTLEDIETPDMTTASASAFAESRRLKIRECAMSILCSSKVQTQNIRRIVSGADTFYMLQIQVYDEILQWHKLGLNVKPITERRNEKHKNFSNQFNFDSIYMNFDAHVSSSDRYTMDSKYMNVQILKSKKLVGGLNVSIERFNAIKHDSLCLILLFKGHNSWYAEAHFLLTVRMGGDLYERIGIGWSYPSIGWNGSGSKGRVVNLI